MKKQNFFLFLLSIILACLVVGCTPDNQAKQPTNSITPTITPVKLINPTGPVVIPVAGLSSKEVTGEIPITVEYWKTIDEATGLLAGDEVQFAVLPITTGVNMAASGIDLVLVGVHEWKVFYLVASDENEFEGWNSLIGKTVYSPEAKGQTVDVLTRYALINKNIVPDTEVNFAYAPAQEIVALMKAGQIDYAALPEPFVTQVTLVGKTKIVLDYQDDWAKMTGAENGIPIAGLFVKRDFLKQHPLETQKVATSIAASTEWSNQNPKQAVEACSQVLPLPEEVILSALKRIKFEYISAIDARDDVADFLVKIQEVYPAGIKKLPDDDFFLLK